MEKILSPICPQPQIPSTPSMLSPGRGFKVLLPETSTAQSTAVDPDLANSPSSAQPSINKPHPVLPQDTSHQGSGNKIHCPLLTSMYQQNPLALSPPIVLGIHGEKSCRLRVGIRSGIHSTPSLMHAFLLFPFHIFITFPLTLALSISYLLTFSCIDHSSVIGPTFSCPPRHILVTWPFDLRFLICEGINITTFAMVTSVPLLIPLLSFKCPCNRKFVKSDIDVLFDFPSKLPYRS